MLCTGQTPNTQIMKSFLPDSVIPDGPGKHSIRVTRTLQVGVPSSQPAPARSPKPTTDGQEQDEEEEPPRPSLQESLQVAITHLRNIQYHHLHDQEELQLAKAQSLAMATVNDELLQKVHDLQTQLAIANSLVDARILR